MRLQQPFGWLLPKQKIQTFFFLLTLTLIVLFGISILDGPLKTPAAPNGIVSFELAGSQNRAQEILASWGNKSRIYAGLSLGLDYLFLFSYAALIALGCILLAEHRVIGATFSRLGIILSWAQFGAAALDAMENYALIQILAGAKEEVWAAMALWCAVPKFIIVLLGLFYLSGGAVWILITRTFKHRAV